MDPEEAFEQQNPSEMYDPPPEGSQQELHHPPPLMNPSNDTIQMNSQDGNLCTIENQDPLGEFNHPNSHEMSGNGNVMLSEVVQPIRSDSQMIRWNQVQNGDRVTSPKFLDSDHQPPPIVETNSPNNAPPPGFSHDNFDHQQGYYYLKGVQQHQIQWGSSKTPKTSMNSGALGAQNGFNGHSVGFQSNPQFMQPPLKSSYPAQHALPNHGPPTVMLTPPRHDQQQGPQFIGSQQVGQVPGHTGQTGSNFTQQPLQQLPTCQSSAQHQGNIALSSNAANTPPWSHQQLSPQANQGQSQQAHPTGYAPIKAPPEQQSGPYFGSQPPGHGQQCYQPDLVQPQVGLPNGHGSQQRQPPGHWPVQTQPGQLTGSHIVNYPQEHQFRRSDFTPMEPGNPHSASNQHGHAQQHPPFVEPIQAPPGIPQQANQGTGLYFTSPTQYPGQNPANPHHFINTGPCSNQLLQQGNQQHQFSYPAHNQQNPPASQYQGQPSVTHHQFSGSHPSGPCQETPGYPRQVFSKVPPGAPCNQYPSPILPISGDSPEGTRLIQVGQYESRGSGQFGHPEFPVEEPMDWSSCSEGQPGDQLLDYQSGQARQESPSVYHEMTSRRSNQHTDNEPFQAAQAEILRDEPLSPMGSDHSGCCLVQHTETDRFDYGEDDAYGNFVRGLDPSTPFEKDPEPPSLPTPPPTQKPKPEKGKRNRKNEKHHQIRTAEEKQKIRQLQNKNDSRNLRKRKETAKTIAKIKEKFMLERVNAQKEITEEFEENIKFAEELLRAVGHFHNQSNLLQEYKCYMRGKEEIRQKFDDKKKLDVKEALEKYKKATAKYNLDSSNCNNCKNKKKKMSTYATRKSRAKDLKELKEAEYLIIVRRHVSLRLLDLRTERHLTSLAELYLRRTVFQYIHLIQNVPETVIEKLRGTNNIQKMEKLRDFLEEKWELLKV